jgi:hypothetical protein
MNDNTRTAVWTTFEASNHGRINFGEVIAQLTRAQDESYRVDYRSGRTTYSMPDGDTLDLGFERPREGIAETFAAMPCAQPSWTLNRVG